jgi:hypothetical protein
MSTDGPPQGRLHERGEAKAQSARPRVLAVADMWLFHYAHPHQEAARNCAPFGGSAAAAAASAGVQ